MKKKSKDFSNWLRLKDKKKKKNRELLKLQRPKPSAKQNREKC